MIPDTVSSGEIIRVIVAMFAFTVSWRGRVVAVQEHALADTLAQTTFCLIHVGLMGNALINMAYSQPPSEQPNVLFSNVLQVLIPLSLARASEHLTVQLRPPPRRPHREATP